MLTTDGLEVAANERFMFLWHLFGFHRLLNLLHHLFRSRSTGSGGRKISQFREWIELAAQCVEILAVGIMVSIITIGTARRVLHSASKIEGSYERYRTEVW
jgi:hypothetical protein